MNYNAQVAVDNNIFIRNRLRKMLLSRVKSAKKPANIAVIGPPGVGKSALLNTLIASITGDYKSFFKVQNFNSSKIVKNFTKKVGPKEYLPNTQDSEKYPTFIHVGCFKREREKVDEEMLRIIFYGRLPDRTPLDQLKRFGLQYGEKALREAYADQVGVEVDRIFFVSSAEEAVPTKLIKCVKNVANPDVSSTIHTKAITIFGILTKKDLVKKDFNIQRRMDSFCEQLGLSGSTERTALLTNYTDITLQAMKLEAKKQVPELDIPALLLLIEACDSVYEPDYAAVPKPLHEASRRLGETRRYRDTMKLNTASQNTLPKNTFLWMFIQTVLLAIVINFFMLFSFTFREFLPTWVNTGNQTQSNNGIFTDPKIVFSQLIWIVIGVLILSTILFFPIRYLYQKLF